MVNPDDKARKFQLELKELLVKYQASIGFEAGGGSDWHGIYGEKMTVRDHRDTLLYSVDGDSIYPENIVDD